MIRSATASVAFLAATACSSANIPISTHFPGIVDRPPAARVFVDANGTFYPGGWQGAFRPSRIDRAGSLLNGATDREKAAVEKDESRQLAALGAMIAGKRRVFVMVHGFNIGEADAALGFDLLERRIDFKPDDAVIRLHWDGKRGTGIGMATIWFGATGDSQVVGIRALRRILNLARDQEVYLISHSRGASVVLSALGEPPFDPGYRSGIERLFPQSFLHVPLEERGNRIHAILLAPAVGYPDFWDASCEARAGGKDGCRDPMVAPPGTRPCPDYREFTTQLLSIRYTTNAGDRTLQKYAFNLRRYFNATDLGYKPNIGVELEKCYPGLMEPDYRIRRPHPHAFTLYAQDPEVATMLRDAGVAAQ